MVNLRLAQLQRLPCSHGKLVRSRMFCNWLTEMVGGKASDLVYSGNRTTIGRIVKRSVSLPKGASVCLKVTNGNMPPVTAGKILLTQYRALAIRTIQREIPPAGRLHFLTMQPEPAVIRPERPTTR